MGRSTSRRVNDLDASRYEQLIPLIEACLLIVLFIITLSENELASLHGVRRSKIAYLAGIGPFVQFF